MDPVNDIRLDEKEIGFWHVEGYLILRGPVDRLAADEMRADIDHILDTIGHQHTRLRQNSQYLAGSRIDAYVNSPRLGTIAAGLLDGPSRLYHTFLAVKSGGGGGKFDFHQDGQYTPMRKGGLVNIWLALTDTTPQNGALLVAPRSHANGLLAKQNAGQGDHHLKVAEEPEYYFPVRLGVGDAVAFGNWTVHASGKNETSEPRYGYATQFFRDGTEALWPDGQWRDLIADPRRRTTPLDVIDPDSY